MNTSSSVRRLRRVGQALALGSLSLLLALSAPSAPDDWDGLGFLASVERFDMAKFAPHPPGYPVYVSALKLASVLTGGPLSAAYVVAITSAVGIASLVFLAARGLWGERVATGSAGFAIGTPIAWRVMSAVGSETLALLFVAVAGWSLVSMRRRPHWAPCLLGAAVGLGLGVRLSWAPLFVPLLLLTPRAARPRAALTFLAALAAWVVPLLVVVGPRAVARLYGVQAHGHAWLWGGTALTEPGVGRLAYLARDIFVDGIGVDADAIGIAIALFAFALAVAGLRSWRRAGWRGARAATFVLAPYALWVGVGQNLRQQPRHVLPLVVAIAIGLAVASAQGRRARVAGIVIAVLVSGRTAMDASRRHRILPAGAQLAAYVAQLPDAEGIAVFAGPSARFFDSTSLAGRASSAPSLDDARLGLTRLDVFPRRILVTSEVEGVEAAHLPVVGTFCRPPRLDRRAPCLLLYDWAIRP